jgi:hypothetical protein
VAAAAVVGNIGYVVFIWFVFLARRMQRRLEVAVAGAVSGKRHGVRARKALSMQEEGSTVDFME